MGQNTTNYNLYKYEDNDTANLKLINPSMDTIDYELKKNADAIKNVNVPVTSVNTKTGDVVLKAEDILDNSGENLQMKTDNKIDKPNSINIGDIAIFDSLKNVIGSGKKVTDFLSGTDDVFISGTYSGNNSSSRKINLPFTPKIVLIMATGSTVGKEGGFWGGLALNNKNATTWNGDITISVSYLGFIVYQDAGRTVRTNDSGYTYTYVAFK